jgi:hypothetical protein
MFAEIVMIDWRHLRADAMRRITGRLDAGQGRHRGQA